MEVVTEKDLPIGTKIKIGKDYAKQSGLEEGEIIELIEGWFEYDNGLYCENQSAPSIKVDSGYDDDFDSIFHLFGNDLENFMDCKIV